MVEFFRNVGCFFDWGGVGRGGLEWDGELVGFFGCGFGWDGSFFGGLGLCCGDVLCFGEVIFCWLELDND